MRFVRDVLDDPAQADEIEAESLEDYAERKRITLKNPTPKARRYQRMPPVKTRRELLDEIAELKETNEELQEQLDQVADIVAPQDQEEDEDDSGE